MPITVLFTRQPVDATQQAELDKLFTSPGFQILKEMVAARCAEAQAKVCEFVVYPENSKLQEEVTMNTAVATTLNACLALLTDFEVNADAHQLYTGKLEITR